MNVLGIDPSLTATGVAYLSEESCYWDEIKPGKGKRGPARIAEITSSIFEWVGKEPLDLIVIEGYSYGAKHQAHQLGELGGVLRYRLWQSDWQDICLVVPPSTLKQFVTGKGNSPKDRVMVEAFKLWGVEGTNNEVDAFGLAAFGWHFLGGDSPYPVPADRKKFVKKVKSGLQ